MHTTKVICDWLHWYLLLSKNVKKPPTRNCRWSLNRQGPCTHILLLPGTSGTYMHQKERKKCKSEMSKKEDTVWCSAMKQSYLFFFSLHRWLGRRSAMWFWQVLLCQWRHLWGRVAEPCPPRARHLHLCCHWDQVCWNVELWEMGRPRRAHSRQPQIRWHLQREQGMPMFHLSESMQVWYCDLPG